MAGIGKNLEVAKGKTPATFSTFLSSELAKRKITEMIGGKDGQRFITSLVAAVSINPNLADCDHFTILSGAMQGEALKLSPSPQLGQYYLVPYQDKKRGKIATFQLGYKGYLQLAIRSGNYKKINVLALKEGELVYYNPLTEELTTKLIEDDEIRENTPTIGYYAMFEYLNGFTKAMYWSRSKMESHASKYSKAFNLDAFRKLQSGKISPDEAWKYSSFWYKDFDAMAYKTMLRQLISKWGIMSIEMQQAMERDGAVMADNGAFEYVDGETGEIIDATPTPEPVPAEKVVEPEPQGLDF